MNKKLMKEHSILCIDVDFVVSIVI